MRLGMLTRVRTDDSAVALTFDDGPDPVSTPRVLDVLGAHGATATFFLDGPAAERHPDLVERIRSEGHTVGNHGWAHLSAAQSPSMRGLRTQVRDMRRGSRAIGSSVSLYRPPFGHESRWTRLAALLTGHQLVYWSVSIKDWDAIAPDEIERRMLAAMRPGSVVLLHDRLRHATDPTAFDRGYMVEGLDRVLAARSTEMQFVSIPKLLSLGHPVVRHRRGGPLPLPHMIEQAT